MHNKSLVYLAGPITGTSYGTCTDWRNYVNQHIDPSIQPLSPLRHKDFLVNEKSIAHSYEDNVMSCAKGITSRDRHDCMRADAILINLLGATRVSIGTVMEIAWGDMLRKQMVLVIEKDNLHRHPMLTESVGYIVDNLDAGISVIERILVPDGQLHESSMTRRLTQPLKNAA